MNGKLDADGAVNILEQHVMPLGDIVQKHKLYTRDVAPVVTQTFEKRINPATKKVETAKVIKTVTITESSRRPLLKATRHEFACGTLNKARLCRLVAATCLPG